MDRNRVRAVYDITLVENLKLFCHPFVSLPNSPPCPQLCLTFKNKFNISIFVKRLRRRGLPNPSPLPPSLPEKAPVELFLSAGHLFSHLHLPLQEKVKVKVLIAFMVNFCNSISPSQFDNKDSELMGAVKNLYYGLK